MKNCAKSCIGMCLLLAFLTGCSLFSGTGSSDVGSVPTDMESASADVERTPGGADIPQEQLEWVADSGWDISPEMMARHSMPVDDSVGESYPESYRIETDCHRYERQVGNSCGGHATAYLLRTLGEDESGQGVYDDMGFKITDGLVLPQGILDYLDAAGHPATLYRGSAGQLKTRLSAGGKPIVLLVGSGMDYQHYIALVGYDEESLYFFDSNQPENPGSLSNAVLGNQEFAGLWENIIPGFERIYIALDA